MINFQVADLNDFKVVSYCGYRFRLSVCSARLPFAAVPGGKM